MATKVILPEMGEGVTDATIMRWLKNEGDTVDQFEPLVEVNTDKVDSEVPSPVTGTVLKILQAPDTVVPVGAILVWIGEPGEEIPADEGDDVAPVVTETPPAPKPEPTPTSTPTPAPVAPPVSMSTPAVVSTGPAGSVSVSPLAAKVAAEHGINLAQVPGSGPSGNVTKDDVLRYLQTGGAASAGTAPAPPNGQPRNTFISPVVARLAGENNIDLMRVTGTGKDSRITKKDIQRVIEAGGTDPMAPAAAPAPASPAPVAAASPKPGYEGMIPGTVMKMTPVRRSIAKHMVDSKHTSPHVTTIMEADLQKVWEHRAANKRAFAQDGAKLTFTAYFVSAVVAALKAYPIVNSSWSDEGVILHKDINIGMAVSLDADGLIVPVIKHADSLSLLGIARAVNDLADRARSKALAPDEVRGGTFTITNHGTSGSLFATPIINQPQCGILGTGMIQKRAVVINDAIAIRPMAYIGLTFDHRILDGAVADYFLGTIKSALESWS